MFEEVEIARLSDPGSRLIQAGLDWADLALPPEKHVVFENEKFSGLTRDIYLFLWYYPNGHGWEDNWTYQISLDPIVGLDMSDGRCHDKTLVGLQWTHFA